MDRSNLSSAPGTHGPDEAGTVTGGGGKARTALAQDEPAPQEEFPALLARTALAQDEAATKEEFPALMVRTALAQEEDLEDTTPLEMVRKKRRSC